MRPFTLVVLASFALVVVAVALRLLLLASRTRKAPELLLGLSLFLPLAGYTTMVATAAARGGVPSRAGVELGAAIIDVSFVAVVAFVWLVFRRKDRWARGLALLLSLVCLAMPVVNHVVPWSDGLPSALLPRAAVRTASYGWAAMEALLYARLMRKRVRFGLAEPLVADRFLLWGLGYVCAAFMIGLFTLAGALHVRHDPWADACAWGAAALGLPGALALGLSFFPPATYARYVERRLGPEASV